MRKLLAFFGLKRINEEDKLNWRRYQDFSKNTLDANAVRFVVVLKSADEFTPHVVNCTLGESGKMVMPRAAEIVSVRMIQGKEVVPAIALVNGKRGNMARPGDILTVAPA
jgi:hypothetical protein